MYYSPNVSECCWRAVPTCPPRCQWAAEGVAHEGYAEQDPIEVAEELTVAARLLANVLRRLNTPDWELRLIYNWPLRTERTLRWVAANTLHDVRHHLLDIHRQLA
jgi:hypothetical protein